METTKYECNLTNYIVEFSLYKDQLQNNYAILEKVETDYRYIKAFMALLRRSIVDLQKKGYSYIRQYIFESEYTELLKDKTSFIVKFNHPHDKSTPVKHHLDVVEIECKIEDFLENYGVAMGISNYVE